MKNWHRHYEESIRQFESTDFLRQVAKTVRGMPITEAQFSALIESIVEAMDLGPTDNLLDLCCGNGVVTRILVSHCRTVKGVDFSESLLEIAKEHNHAPNLEYFHGSVLELEATLNRVDHKFSRVLMYEALQCFDESDLPSILQSVGRYITTDSIVLFGSVPDKSKLWDFYDTPERREEYFRRVSEGTEAIGTWWDRERIQESAVNAGFLVEFLNQPPGLHTSHYRFDARFVPIAA